MIRGRRRLRPTAILAKVRSYNSVLLPSPLTAIIWSQLRILYVGNTPWKDQRFKSSWLMTTSLGANTS